VSREVWITGTGLISALGEGDEAHWQALNEGGIRDNWIDHETFAPFTVHPMCELELKTQIPKRGDQRSMGPFMHYGVYAAGMALEAAGIKGNEELLERTHLIVGVGGGERDEAADETILQAVEASNDREGVLNEKLLNELRPTLFLAQLPNLFAGNISIVHGVTGSSRTFMGEEGAGVDAVRIAFQRIQAGQGDLFLVGSAYNAARRDLMLLINPSGVLGQGAVDPLWQRSEAGMCLGSMGAFLVVESREHAEARGAVAKARLSSVQSDRVQRKPGASKVAAESQFASIREQLNDGALPVLSGASGVGPITREEHDFLETLGTNAAVRGTAGALGHGVEAMFVANLNLAVNTVAHGALFPAINDNDALERDVAGQAIDQVLVTQWGYQGGEGMALVTKL